MEVDTTTFRAQAFDSRVRFLVMHYTAGNFASAVTDLTGPKVSAHYLVPDPQDATYQARGFDQVRVFGLVSEADRAWHAGVSSWRGHNNLNDTAIGIEIVNRAWEADGQFVFTPFDSQQIEAVKCLALDILQRYPDITPLNVVGHSDIAPTRKSDPGPLFPWQALHLAGIGPWYDEATKAGYVQRFTQAPLQPDEALQLLARYGYDVSGAVHPQGIQLLWRAFQMHYRPSNYAGVLDVETMAIVSALVEKYC